MTVVINSNTAANVAARNLSKANDALRKSLARLSSGNRINSAMDDAGGLSVAYKINSRLSRLEANNQNIQNGTSFLQVQEGALKNAAEIVSRMSELRTMAADITKNDSDIQNYNYEFRELQKELNSLRGQKFNGVSLFGSLASGSENLTLDISDDGTGAGVEISRIGLFENLKSKFGADGELNSGSHGSYRQLVGDFVTDAGILDASPGYATRNYSKGSVVYRNGPTDAESGYFMALKDVMAGSSIEDTLGTSSNWIRVADRSGNGFSELYNDSPVYDQNNVKFNSDGEPVAYLKGDIVKVQAHWADNNSFIYLKANSDVPRNQTMDSILSEGLGENALFDYISVNRSGDVDGRPTTEFLRQNASAPTASLFNPSSSASFLNLLSYHGANNNYTPGHIRVDVADDPFLNGTSSGVVAIDPNKQETTISNIQGDMQVKKVRFDNIYGNENDQFEIKVAISENQNLDIKGPFVGSNQYAVDDVVSDSGMLNWYKIGSIQTSDNATLSVSLDFGTQAINVGDIYWDTASAKYLKVTVADIGDPTASPPTMGSFSTIDATFDDLVSNGLVEDISSSISTTTMNVGVDSTMNADVNGSANLAQAILDKVLSVKLADGVTDAFDTANSSVSNSEFIVGGVNVQDVAGFDVYGTPAARDFYIQIQAQDNTASTGFFDPNQSVEATRFAVEMETSNYNLSGTNHPSAHPIDNNQNQFVTYEFQKKFWGDGSEISFGNNAEDGHLVWDGSRFWKALGDVGSFDPSSPSIQDWNVQAGAAQGSALEAAGITNSQILGRFESTTKDYASDEVVSNSTMSSWYKINASFSTIPEFDSSTFQATLDSGSTAIGVNVGDIFWDSDQNEYRKVQTITAGVPASSTPGAFVATSATIAEFNAAGHVDDVTGQVSLYEDLEDLANDISTGVVVAAGDINAGAYYARIDQTTGAPSSIEYLADSLNVAVTSEGTAYSIDVDYVSGSTAAEGKELTAQAIVDAINSATANGEIGSVVEAELINSNEVKLTAKKSGTPFDTVITPANNHTDLTSGHDFPAGNTGGTTAAGADVDITKAVAAPITTPGSSSSSNSPYSIFKPSSDWGIKEWDSSYPHQNGSLVWNVNSGTGNPEIWELGTNVKGFWNGGTVQSGEIFLHNGSWYQAQSNNLTETPGSSSLNWTLVDPLLVGATDVTADYMDLSNTNLWSKTHFGNLIGTTIEQDYVRGDNFFYEGKHYVYVSSSPSSDYKYDPTQTGLTEFEVLLEEGAVMELPIYVDTVGRGGSPDLPEGVYYKPNQNLEYIDRLPDSGLVRTNSIERRGEPSDSDNIYNSNDDLYYGGLNPGADGIYGTKDDVYATTAYSEFAKAGGHIDSDADNNKDLLNESNNLTDFSVMDFVDFIQTIANFRAINGGSMSRLEYAGRMLAENRSNLEAAYGRIMDADIAMESSRFAKHNVMVQASASMVAQANQLTNVALTLLGR